MSDLLLGVDIGTASSKGVLTRPDGTIVATAQRPHQLSLPRPGWAEHDGEAVWWADFVAIARELAPLRLEKSRFAVEITPLSEENWGSAGSESVQFLIATNPGQTPGPLARVASGGELSRLMLAFKMVLAQFSPVPTLIFDEVDAGIGGATAAAVGERLARVAEHLQVLVVTHSPQVAARAAAHFRVAKQALGGRAATTVETLDAPARREEIARMLAGETITEAARAAADSLLGAV